MSSPNDDKPGNEKFLKGLMEELQAMSDTEALEGENAEALVKLGERLLKNAREEAGRMRMAEAKRKLTLVSKTEMDSAPPSAAEARKYFASRPSLTLAARGLNDLSDEDVLDLFRQARELEHDVGKEDGDG